MDELVTNSPKFKFWKQAVESTGTKITNLKVLAAISREAGKLFCALIDTKMVTPENETVPRCMLIRGDSVVIVPVIHCDDGEVYTLLVRQRRPADGKFADEFPGGLLDNGDEFPAAIAVQELAEELEMEISQEELIPLSPEPVKVCTALLDEKIHFYYFVKNFSKEELQQLDRRRTGHVHEGESLEIRVTPMNQVTGNYNLSALVGIKLLEKALGRQF